MYLFVNPVCAHKSLQKELRVLRNIKETTHKQILAYMPTYFMEKVTFNSGKNLWFLVD